MVKSSYSQVCLVLICGNMQNCAVCVMSETCNLWCNYWIDFNHSLTEINVCEWNLFERLVSYQNSVRILILLSLSMGI